MELILPDQIALDKVSTDFMRAIDETARRVHELRPLPPEVVRRIQDDLIPERVQQSNAVEGNTLSLRETKMILETGQLIASKRREAMEARNLGEAVRAMSEVDADDLSIHTEGRLLDIHRLILRDINDEWAGQFRNRAVKIQGASWKPPDHSVVPALVQRVLERLAVKGDEPPLLMGVWAHWAMAAIHPFSDGNGRTARLWQDLVFVQRGLTCASIHPGERGVYFESLQRADDGDLNPLVQLIGQRMLNTFDLYDKAVQADAEITEWARGLVADVDESGEVERKLKYQRWLRRMEELRNAFQVCAEKIAKATDAIDVEVVAAGTPDYFAYENLRNGAASAVVFMLLRVRTTSKNMDYIAECASGACPELDTEDDRSEPRVYLRVRALRSKQKTRLLNVFVVDDQFVRCRRGSGGWECDRASATQIAMDCIEDLIRALDS